MKHYYRSLSLFALLLITFTNVWAQSESGPNRKALTAVTEGKFREAIQILDGDVRKEKNLFESYKFRAQVKRMIGDFTGALADLDAAIGIRADDGSLYEQRAEIGMFGRRGMDQTLADLNLAIANGINNARIYVSRGTIRSNSGDLSGALKDYQTAIEMRPGYAQAYVGLSSTYRRLNDEPKAIETLERFLAEIENSNDAPKPVQGKVTAGNSVIIPELSDGKTIVGQSVIISGSSVSSGSRSPEDLQKSTDHMEQSKNTSLAYFNLADMYERKSDYQKALETVNRGMVLDTTDPYGFLVRGKIKANLGDLDSALKDLDRAVEISHGIPHVYVERGLAYVMLGREQEAQADFDRFLKIIPGAKAGLEKRIEIARSKRAQ